MCAEIAYLKACVLSLCAFLKLLCSLLVFFFVKKHQCLCLVLLQLSNEHFQLGFNICALNLLTR